MKTARHVKMPLLESEMSVDFGRYSYALCDKNLLQTNPIMVISNDDENIGSLANDLQRLYEVNIIRRLPFGMANKPTHRNLTAGKI